MILSLYRSVEAQLKADKYGVAQNLKNRKGKPKDMNVVESWRKTKKRRNTYLKRIDRCSPKRDSSIIGSPRLKPAVDNKIVSDYSDPNHTISHALNGLSNVTVANKVKYPSSAKFVQILCKVMFSRDAIHFSDVKPQSLSNQSSSARTIPSNMEPNESFDTILTPKRVNRALKDLKIQESNVDIATEKKQSKNETSTFIDSSFFLSVCLSF